MNGKLAKRARRIVYGTDGSHRFRKYTQRGRRVPIRADQFRRQYQAVKKALRKH